MSETTSDFADEFDDESTADEGLAPAAAGSPLATLRERREQAKAELYLDLPVPRLDPPVFVRFRPLDLTALANGQKRVQKAKDPDVSVVVNAGFIATACVGIFEVIEGNQVSVDPDERSTNPDEWLTFGPRLAELLGAPAPRRAADVVRALYLTDGDVIATATEIATWSGYTGEDLDKDFEGN